MAKKKKNESAFDKLSAREQKFFLEYIKYLNAKYAYKILHPKCKDSTAESEGPGISRKPQFQEALKEYYRELWDKKEDYIGKTLKRLLDILDFNVTDFIDKNGVGWTIYWSGNEQKMFKTPFYKKDPLPSEPNYQQLYYKRELGL